MDKSSFVEILNSKVFLLILGFILTTVFGKIISDWIQNKNWRNQTRINLYQSRYDEGKDVLDELSKQIGTRFFLLQRLLWSIESKDKLKIKEREKQYFESVIDWNSKTWYYRNKIRLLIGDEEAIEFLDYGDDFRPDIPISLHYLFVKTHKTVIQAKTNEELQNAQNMVERLNHICSNYLEELTTKFLHRSSNLELLNYNRMKEAE